MNDWDGTTSGDLEPTSAVIGVLVVIAACLPLKVKAQRVLLLVAILLVALVGIGTQYMAYENASVWSRYREDAELFNMLIMLGPGGLIALLRLLGNAFSST
ncbi:hypothetical protein [Streptomyces sp. NPDC090022]|uniref:hypothetical protein n=1 Tax=Streptomyces sp. NPDC090022 TaxID=3365920 RepID=UPI0037F51CFA